MRKEKKTVLTNGRATTMKDLREASWTDRERDKFLDRFNPYEVDDRVDGRFEIDVNTENGPLLLVDANDKKYSAYLEFTAKGRLHGDDYIDVEKVRYSIYNLIVDDYNADLVENDKWLDRIDERGITVVEEGNVQDEALLKELHSTDGRSSLDDLMEALTLVALDHQWSEGNYDIEDDDYIVFYFYSSEGTKELRESIEKSEEPKLEEKKS